MWFPFPSLSFSFSIGLPIKCFFFFYTSRSLHARTHTHTHTQERKKEIKERNCWLPSTTSHDRPIFEENYASYLKSSPIAAASHLLKQERANSSYSTHNKHNNILHTHHGIAERTTQSSAQQQPWEQQPQQRSTGVQQQPQHVDSFSIPHPAPTAR